MKKYSISPLMLMFMAAFIVIDGTVYALYAVGCALWHEVWHIIVLKFVGGGVQHLSFRGFRMKLNITNIGYGKEAAVALAGPAASLFGFCIAAVACAVKLTKPALFAAVSNLAVFAVNILPIYPLDGGRALYCLLCKRLTQEKAAKITKVISFLFLLPLSVLSVMILIQTGYNLSLMLICMYLTVMLIGIREI